LSEQALTNTGADYCATKAPSPADADCKAPAFSSHNQHSLQTFFTELSGSSRLPTVSAYVQWVSKLPGERCENSNAYQRRPAVDARGHPLAMVAKAASRPDYVPYFSEDIP